MIAEMRRERPLEPEAGSPPDADASDPDVASLAEQRRLAAGCRSAARRALEFARLYRDEEGAPHGDRERACVAQALAWRRSARDAAAGRPIPVAPRPGLARAHADEAPAPASKRSA